MRGRTSLLRILAWSTVSLLAACGPRGSATSANGTDESGTSASTPAAIAHDVKAARGTGPTSTRPGASEAPGRASPPTAQERKAPPPAEAPPSTATMSRPAPPQSDIAIGGFTPRTIPAGSPQLGRRFALDNCQPCHVVARDQSAAIRFADAPAFSTIANAPNTTEIGLNVWLTNPHPTMPTLVLSPEESANVIAYILSLRDRH